MKIISLSVVGGVVGEDLSSVADLRDKALKQTYDANNEAQAAKAQETALKFADAATEAEAAALADVRERATALVEALQEAGVRITRASLLFEPRPGSGEQTETVDLLAKPEANGEGGAGNDPAGTIEAAVVP